MRSLVDSAVTAEPLGRFEETAILAAGFNLQELAIGAPLLFEIAVVRDAPVFHDHHFIAAFLDIA